MGTGKKYMILFIVALVVSFLLTHMTSILTSRQSTELTISSILFVFLFGIVHSKVTGLVTPHFIAVYGFYYIIWYFTTKAVTNAVLKDSNGIVITT
jgi:hypothetical protein